MATSTPNPCSNLLHDLPLWDVLQGKAAEQLEQEGIAYITTAEHHDLLHALVNRDEHFATGGFWFFGLSRVAMLKSFLDEQGVRISKFPSPSPTNRPGTFVESIRYWEIRYR